MSVKQESTPTWVQSWLDAWNERDGAAINAHLASDVVYQDMTLGERFESPEAVRAFADEMTTTFSSDYGFIGGPQSVSGDDSYAFEWTLTGTNDCADPQRGLPATGKKFEIPGISIGRLRDGKIVENRDYWDLAGYLMQVGLMEQPG
ncbi:ester cyclase [Pseudonocardia endophytica]|nr:ester cyclase [Pseudonocardia endophytica]